MDLDHFNRRMKQRWPLSISIALVAVLAHVESLDYWFTSTDTITLIASSRPLTIDKTVEIFLQPLMSGTRFTTIAQFYRPLASLSYTFDYAVWGIDPTGYHLTNLILHGAAVALSALAVVAITDSKTGSLTGLLVAIHPLTVEVVPSAERRHSILLTIFWMMALLLLIRSRQRGSRRLLAGSVGAYALALLGKELALLFPGLVFMWVALDELADQGTMSSRDAALALRTSLHAVAPFVLVTVAYIGVRFEVLGGLGGYRETPPLSIEGAIDIVVKYILSLTYPRDFITAVIKTGGNSSLLTLGGLLGVLAIVLFGIAIRRRHKRSSTLALAVVITGMGSIPLVTVLAPQFGIGEILLGYPTSQSVVIGGLFVMSLVTGAFLALWTLLSQQQTTNRDILQPLAFFAVWLAAPLPLFLMGSKYTIRNGYLFLIPAMGIVSLVLITAVRNFDLHTRELDASVVLAVTSTIFVLSLVVTSPLVHDYNGWRTSGEVNQVTLINVERALTDAPDDATVRISKLPRNVRSQKKSFPRVQSMGYIRPGTVEAWLMLRDPGNEMLVRNPNLVTLPQTPANASVTTERRNGAIWVKIRYMYR